MENRPTELRPQQKRGEELFTIEDAFYPNIERDRKTGDEEADHIRATCFGVERNLRALMMLMYHMTQDGNKPLEGTIVIGVSDMLGECAAQLAQLELRVAIYATIERRPAGRA
jgi:hypothetical protein